MRGVRSRILPVRWCLSHVRDRAESLNPEPQEPKNKRFLYIVYQYFICNFLLYYNEGTNKIALK